MQQNLRVPGPTPVPDKVARAGAQPMINHRGPEFAALMHEVLDGLKPFFGTTGEPLILTGSGSGAQEAAVVNVLSPGDPVLAVVGGVFGARFAEIAEAFGAGVRRLDVEWGQAARPEAVAEALQAFPASAVILTHNETSTGVTNDIPGLVRAVRTAAPDATVLVDGVSSIGALPFDLDGWDVDVAISGSQKAWMAPPGLSMVAVSPRGWDAYERARMPRYYWDFGKAARYGAKGTTPFTPAVGVIRSLAAALSLMREEGPEAIFARHRRLGQCVREGIDRLGLELFAQREVASNTVTAVRVPAGMDVSKLIKGLRERHGVVVAGGQDWLKGRILRIGHMGYVHEEDVEHLLSALASILGEEDLSLAV
jgi:aspartate aminotransferase-like enzyme